jgi:hypothetical protein
MDMINDMYANKQGEGGKYLPIYIRSKDGNEAAF